MRCDFKVTRGKIILRDKIGGRQKKLKGEFREGRCKADGRSRDQAEEAQRG